MRNSGAYEERPQIKTEPTGRSCSFLSSYSEHQPLEYGYNRDGLDLPQINLFLIEDKDMGIQVMNDLCPGSISDVSTLKKSRK